MPNTATTQTQIDDATLLTRLRRLVSQDRATSARMLWHLAEVDARGLYRDEGYSSLFDYCVKRLHMSENEASLRIRAARLSRIFPGVLARVERGELHLSALRVLAPVLTEDNHQALFSAATHKTKRQVEQMLADMAPRPDARSFMRKLPDGETGAGQGKPSASRPASSPLEMTSLWSTPDDGDGPTACMPSGSHVGTSVPGIFGRPADPTRTAPNARAGMRAASRADGRGDTTPLGAQRYKVQFTADEKLHEQLRQAQELLRHQVPDGDLATIVGKAMTLLVTQLKKQRFGHRTRPRGSARDKAQPRKDASNSALDKAPKTKTGRGKATAASPSEGDVGAATNPNSRHIPAKVRRAVVERDGGRCTFVSASGHRCEATGMLEFHHEAPYAKGGFATVENIRLLCRSHNALLAERDFGRELIHQRRHGKPVNPPTVPEPSPG